MTQLRDSIKAMQQETIKDQQKLREELTEFDKNIRYAITILFGLNYSFTFNGLHNLLTLFYLFFFNIYRREFAEVSSSADKARKVGSAFVAAVLGTPLLLIFMSKYQPTD